MNSQAFSAAKAAYQRGDWAGAVSALNAATDPGEVWGEADHLRGNALMKLGLYAEAADAYARALTDAGYGQTHAGALSCNRGRALVAAGRPDLAVSCFEAAVSDPSYATPYKAHLALGNLYERQGKVREAGVAWRNAAIDEANPDPASALMKLGGCFMSMGRPVDAVEAYRTALDFSTDASQGPVYGQLGLAYMASNRVQEAADAFAKAASSGTYQLTAEQAASYEAARKAMAAIAGGPSETDQMLSQAGYGTEPDASGSLDPLDPMGKSGEFIPSPEDTGFFSVTEEDLMKADKRERKMKRKHKHRAGKVIATILVLVVLAAAAGGFAYYKGYGWPTQESVISGLFEAASSGGDVSGYLASSVSSDQKAAIESVLPSGATARVDGIDRTMTSSKALVVATLTSGGTQNYTVTLTRDGLGWKVVGVELSFSAESSQSSTTTSTGTLATSASTQDVAETAASATAEAPEAATAPVTE